MNLNVKNKDQYIKMIKTYKHKNIKNNQKKNL